ncbi:MAG: ATP-binding protein [Ktedonobacterales bacterium]
MALERSRTFADLLREYRRAAEMTQERLAEGAGLSVRALRKLESGASVAPRRDTIDLLATALKLAPEKRTLLEASASRQRFLSGSFAPQPVDPVSVALVGRSSELVLLEKHLAGKGPPLLVLAGEPGIGKTRLLREASSRGRTQGWSVLEGGCHRRSGQEPYAPLLTALASSVRGQSPQQVRRILEGCAWLVRLLPELAESSLVPLPEWQLPPAQERRLMFAAVGRYLANLAGPAGTLLVLDDLQWAGQDALDLLADLLRTLDEQTGRQLRVVAAYRSTEVLPADPLGILVADLAREGLAAPVELGRLALEAAHELAKALFVDLPSGDRDELQKQMVERTGGVPFFLVSWAQALQNRVNAEVLEAESGGQSEERNEDQLPWTVTQSIRQRLALLPEVAHDLVNILAVSGREAAISVLLTVATRGGLEQAETLAALDLAGQAGLLVEEEGGKGYAFAHDLIREVAVADLGAARSSSLHRWVGEAILEVTPPGREPPAAELAWHFARGGEPARALSYAIRAGEQAEAAYAHAEAERHYQMALELSRELGDTEREAEVLERLADVLRVSGRMRETLALLEAAAEIRREAGNLDEFAWDSAQMPGPIGFLAPPQENLARLRTLLNYLARQAGVTQTEATQGAASDRDMHERPLQTEAIPAATEPADLADSVAQADTLLELAERAVALLSARTAGLVYFRLALYFGELSQHREAISLSERALSYAQTAGDRTLQVRTLYCLGGALSYLDQPAEALAAFETAYPVAEQARDLEGLCLIQASRALVLMDVGDVADAKRSAQQALEAAEQYGMPDLIARMLGTMARMSFTSGDWDQVLDSCRRAAEIVRGLDAAFPSLSEDIAALQGRIYLARGVAQAAHECLQVAMHESRGPNSMLAVLPVHAALAEADLVHQDAATALARLGPWLDRTSPYEQAFTGLIPLIAWACLQLGEDERAADVLAECLAHARERHYQLQLADALRIEAILALRQSRWEDAKAALDEALVLARSMPYPYAEAKALYVYGDLHAARGNLERAREQYAAALAILDRLGERLYAEQVEQALARVSRPQWRRNRGTADDKNDAE